jgi:hypothetical protein
MPLAVIAGEVPAEKKKAVAFRIAFRYRPRPHRKAGTDLYIVQFISAGAEGFVEYIRLRKPHTIIQPHAGTDKTRRLLT